jgi:hypothetical protein
LLLYNRKLRRVVAIELKRGKFKPEYKGQMEFYLNYLKDLKLIQEKNLQLVLFFVVRNLVLK